MGQRETEGVMMAAREQVLRTRNIGKAVDKEDIDSSCRMCGETEEKLPILFRNVRNKRRKNVRTGGMIRWQW